MTLPTDPPEWFKSQDVYSYQEHPWIIIDWSPKEPESIHAFVNMTRDENTDNIQAAIERAFLVWGFEPNGYTLTNLRFDHWSDGDRERERSFRPSNYPRQRLSTDAHWYADVEVIL